MRDFAIQAHKAEGRMEVVYEKISVALSGGEMASLRKPRYSVKALGFSPMHRDVMMSPRIAPQMIGLGLLEAIPEADILANADPDDKDQDEISGKAKFITRRDPLGMPEQSRQLTWPYTVPLVHDMGDGLADGRPGGRADGREWRTAPLWAIGLTKTVNGHSFFLHDGRARRLLEAILWHGDEAEAAKQKVIAMPPGDRRNLIRFIKSL